MCLKHLAVFVDNWTSQLSLRRALNFDAGFPYLSAIELIWVKCTSVINMHRRQTNFLLSHRALKMKLLIRTN